MTKQAKTLEEQLNEHPGLKEFVVSSLEFVNSSQLTAHEADEMLVERIREFGPKLLEEWSKKKEIVECDNFLFGHPSVKFHGEKDIKWHTSFGDICIKERTFISANKLVRPFSCNAEIKFNGYTQLLQRRITDFGSEHSFGKAVKRIKEHYGIILPESSIRKITQAHGENLLMKIEMPSGSNNANGVKQAIIETDGCMIPKIEFDAKPDESDLRKKRATGYKEVRLSLGYVPGMIKPVFEATSGKPDVVGRQLMLCAQQVGYGKETDIHSVGDGARWIAEQIEIQFGSKGSYLIDFYHLCEYLFSASKTCSEKPDVWYKEKKQLMLDGNVTQVLQALLPYIELPSILDEQAPVRRCHRYIKNRPEQFKYPEAIQKELPIGSGKVESAHQYVIQNRMKIPGAWWKVDNMDKMLALLTCRENNKWEEYWNCCDQVA